MAMKSPLKVLPEALDLRDFDAKIRSAVNSAAGRKLLVKPSQSFVTDLSFDSLRMVTLSIALEEQFGRPLLLNDWISQFSDPRELTIGSLSAYVASLLEEDE
jgi:acyl carrier protein